MSVERQKSTVFLILVRQTIFSQKTKINRFLSREVKKLSFKVHFLSFVFPFFRAFKAFSFSLYIQRLLQRHAGAEAR